MRRIAEALKRFSYRFGDEVGLHRGIKLALESQQIDYLHEHVTGDDRLDFLCPGGIVIEAKIKGSMADALRQVDRYLARDDVNGVVLATTTLWGRKAAHRPQLHGNPLMRSQAHTSELRSLMRISYPAFGQKPTNHTAS